MRQCVSLIDSSQFAMFQMFPCFSGTCGRICRIDGVRRPQCSSTTAQLGSLRPSVASQASHHPLSDAPAVVKATTSSGQTIEALVFLLFPFFGCRAGGKFGSSDGGARSLRGRWPGITNQTDPRTALSSIFVYALGFRAAVSFSFSIPPPPPHQMFFTTLHLLPPLSLSAAHTAGHSSSSFSSRPGYHASWLC